MILEYIEPRLHKFIKRVEKSPAVEQPGSLLAIVTANILIAGDMLLSSRLHEAVDFNPGTVVRAVGCYVIGFIVVDRVFNAVRSTSPPAPQSPPSTST